MAESTEEKLNKAEEMRRRAQARAAKAPGPLTMFSKDDGFDPPLVVVKPSVEQLERAAVAQRFNDPFGVFRGMLGDESYERVVRFFGDDLDTDILQELTSEVQEHFYGQGSSDVPGGSSAS